MTKPFDFRLAEQLARASDLAYDYKLERQPDLEFELRKGRSFSVEHSHVTVMCYPDRSVVAFRGTDPERGDWVQNFKAALVPFEVDEEQEPGAKSWYFDCGHMNRPIERVTLSVGEGEFARPLRIFGRNSFSNNWQAVYSGEIHRLGSSERLRMEHNAKPLS